VPTRCKEERRERLFTGRRICQVHIGGTIVLNHEGREKKQKLRKGTGKGLISWENEMLFRARQKEVEKKRLPYQKRFLLFLRWGNLKESVPGHARRL